MLRATYPGARIRAAVRGCGVPVQMSIDAGDYVCNATLFRSLLRGWWREVGFIHVPRVRSRRPARGRAGLSSDDLARAVFAAVLALARPPLV